MSRKQKSIFESDLEQGTGMVTLENDEIRIRVIPGMGGKMVELTRKPTGTQFLIPPGETGSFPLPDYGDQFDERFAYGFDECFPSITPSVYRQKGREIAIPDHGELWSRPWSCSRSGDTLSLSIRGNELDYHFSKQISLEGNGVNLRYTLENNSDTAFHYIWAAHPLLSVDPGDKLLLPSGVDTTLVESSTDSGIGKGGDRLRYPVSGKGADAIDWSTVQDKSLGKALKLYTDRLETGRAGMYRAGLNETILFVFNPHKIPYLGLWLCYGGWPPDDGTGEKGFTVALEPAAARPDALHEAVRREEAACIGAGVSTEWELKIICEEGKAEI